MSESKMLLWCDVESTGLLQHETDPSILEASWCVTNPAGRQLTPLRQRYSLLQARSEDSRRHCPVYAGPHSTEILWTHEDARRDRPTAEGDDGYPDPFVRDMHAGNGLAVELCNLERHVRDLELPAGRIGEYLIVEWEDLQARIIRDLETAAWGGLGKRELTLAGGGVSHYEHRFLPDRMPDLFSDDRMHYAAIDLSTVLRTFETRMPVLPRKADGIIAWANAQLVTPPTDLETSRPWRYLDIADDFQSPERDPLRWSTMAEDDHRAASGVARAIMAYRLLPEALVANLGNYDPIAG